MKLARVSIFILAVSVLTSFKAYAVTHERAALSKAAVQTGHNAEEQNTDKPEQKALTLREAVDAAITNNPQVKVTNATIEQADANIPVIRSTLLPNINLLTSASDREDALNGGPRFNGDSYNTYTTDLHLVQPLFQISLVSAIDSAKKDRDLRRLDLEITRRNLTSNVLQAYFTVVLDMRNLETLKRNQDIQQESLSTAQRRERTGRGQTLDVLQIKTQLALLKSQIATAQNALDTASATLANLEGDQLAHVIRVRDSLDAPDLKQVDAHIDLAKFRLPELDQNKISIDQIEDLKRVSLGTNLPTLNLTGDYTFNAYKRADLFDRDSAAWSVMLNLNIPIFSGFSSIYQQEGFNAQRSRLEYERENIVNNTNLSQVSSRKALETAEESIFEGREALRDAVASFDEARRMFRLGTIDFLQLLTIDQAYVQAESAYNTYKYNYVAALANYFVNSGQDLASLVDLMEGANQ